MFFELNDGVPRFAIGKVSLTETRVDFNGTEKTVQYEKYLFTTAEMAEYQDAVLIAQPTAEILTRAQALIGRTLSKSEFEKLLFAAEGVA